MSEGQAARGDPWWIILYSSLGVAMAAQLFLLFLLPVGHVRWLVSVGWVLLALSAVLGWVPILVFRRHGRVAKGMSYIHTTQLVTCGPYAMVRHLQFVAWDILALAVMCITQHWGVYAAGVIGIVVDHLTMTKADRDLVEKLGDPYREYMARVPRWNLVAAYGAGPLSGPGAGLASGATVWGLRLLHTSCRGSEHEEAK